MNPAGPSMSQDAPAAGDSVKGIYFIVISQFGIAISFNCIMSFMPFYVLKVSAYGRKETMLWIGMIMGATSMVAALAAPFWGSLTARIRPKLLFEIGIFCNGVIFFIMGFVESLPLILTLRLIQGALGGVSTIGPLLGAYAVTLFGYHSPFIIALVVVFFSLVYCHSHVRDIPAQPKSPRPG